jgi:hypothetical protein
MKGYFISIAIVLIGLMVYSASFGRSKNEQGRQERKGQREAQSIAAEEKNKPQKERQSMSEEERQKLRDKMRERAAGRSLMSGRQMQLKVIESIEQQLAKLKAAVKESPDRQDFRELREASSEQRAKFREEWQKARQQQQQMVSAIQQQLTKLAGPKPAEQATRPDILINELKVIHEMAINENAQKTAERVDKIIAKYRGTPQLVRPVQRGKPDEQPNKPK